MINEVAILALLPNLLNIVHKIEHLNSLFAECENAELVWSKLGDPGFKLNNIFAERYRVGI